MFARQSALCHLRRWPGNHLAAATIYLAVTFIYAWPLLSRLTTTVPGGPNEVDVATFVWNVGWVRAAVLGDGALFFSDRVLVPFGADLRAHTYAPLLGLAALPATFLVGVIGAFNLVWALTLLLNGLASYLLVREMTGRLWPSVVAGAWIMLAAPSLAFLRSGRPSLAAVWAPALALLALHRLLAAPNRRTAVALGLMMAATLFIDLQITLYTALWLALYALYRLLRDRRTLLTAVHWPAYVLAIALPLLPFFFLFWPAFSADLPEPSLADTALYAYRLSHFVDPWLIPYISGFEMGVMALLALFLWRRRPLLRIWLVGAIFFLVLSLGPTLAPTGVTLPFAWLHEIPGMRQFRTPYRMTTPATLGLGVVAGVGLSALAAPLRARGRAGRWLIALAALVAVGGRLLYALSHDPLALQLIPRYATYEALARVPGDFTLIEAPFGVRSGLGQIGQGGERLQIYQSIHGKRLMNGMVARLPRDVFDAYRAHPALRLLSGEAVAATPDTLNRDLADVLAWVDGRYIIVHRDMLGPEASGRITAFLDAHPGLVRLGASRDLVIYGRLDVLDQAGGVKVSLPGK